MKRHLQLVVNNELEQKEILHEKLSCLTNRIRAIQLSYHLEVNQLIEVEYDNLLAKLNQLNVIK